MAPLYRFADWPNPEVPNGRIGVYTVWRGDQLIYVGMAGRALGPSAVAAWAGHSVEMLMRVYARCVAGLEDVWIGRMDQALHLGAGS